MTFSFVALLATIGFSQGKVSIKGTVYQNNEKKSPLCMAYVYVDNTVYCTYTDEKGNFELDLPKGKHNVKISFKGYTSANRVVNVKKSNDVNMDITLIQENFAEKR